MIKDHLVYLRCPVTLLPLQLKVLDVDLNDRVKEGILFEPSSGKEYPIVNYIPRFVPVGNYATSFGFQWNLHRNTQQDEYSQTQLSSDRFFNESRWGRNLSGQLMLEVGCGAGRFTKHAVTTGAMVVSLDYSNAVEANYSVNGHNRNLLIIQADVYALPIEAGTIDKAFCFGVLQHTPDPEKSFRSIVAALKPGGSIATDVYLKSWKSYLHVKPYIRFLVKNYSAEALYRFTKGYVDFFWPASKLLRKSKIGQKLISRFIADRSELLPNASDEILREWAYLDTFDWFSPAYDFPQTLTQFKKWHQDIGLANIEVHYGFNGVEGRGTKK